MKTKVLYLITALLVLTLSFVVFAYTGNPTSAKSDTCAMKDCCKDGKCSMSKDGKCACDMHKTDGTAEHKCTADCCKDGKCTMSADGKCNCKDGSCSMMKKDGKEMSAMNHSADSCCKDGKCSMNSDCCKDGVCKMGCCKDGKCDIQAHKKDGEATAMKGDCCKDKDSCPMMKKGEKKDK